MSAKERKLLREEINRKLHLLVNKESKENDFISSSQMLTERQATYLNIAHSLRRQENQKHKRSLPVNVDNTALPHVNTGKAMRVLDNINGMIQNKGELHKIYQVHEFRVATPFYTNPNWTLEKGRVMNYSQHLGALLHTPRYVDFMKQRHEDELQAKREKAERKSKIKRRPSPKVTSKSSKSTSRTKSNSTENTSRISGTLSRTSSVLSKSSKESSSTSKTSSRSNIPKTSSRSNTSNTSSISNSSKTLSKSKSNDNLSLNSEGSTISKFDLKSSFSNNSSDDKDEPRSSSKKTSESYKTNSSTKRTKKYINPSANNEDSTESIKNDKARKSSSSKLDKTKNNKNKSTQDSEENNQSKDNKIRKSSISKLDKENNNESNQQEKELEDISDHGNEEVSDLQSDSSEDEDQKPNDEVDSKSNQPPDTKSDDNFYINESEEKSDVSVHDADLYEEMEEFLDKNTLSLESLKMWNRYFEAFIKYRVTMKDYVKNYGDYLEKNNDKKFIDFRKIIKHYEDKVFSDDYLSKCQMLIIIEIKDAEDSDSNKPEREKSDSNKSEKEKSDEELNDNMVKTLKRVFDLNENDLKNRVHIDIEPKQTEANTEKEVINYESNNRIDENNEEDDFYDSFHRLYRNSIVKMSEKDKEELKKLIQQYENQDNPSTSTDRYNDDDFVEKFRDIFKRSIYELNDDDLVMIQQIFDDDTSPDPNDLNNETVKPFHELSKQPNVDKEKARELVESQLRQRKASNIAPVLLTKSDDEDNDEDFAESFQRLFRNSIGVLTNSDLENIQQLIEQRDRQLEQNDNETIQPFLDLIENTDISPQDSKDVLELIGEQITLRKTSKSSKDMADIEEAEDTEIMIAFRNLFRTSVDGLTAKDFDKLNELIDKK